MKAAIRIGPAGWSYPDWNGVVYPTRKPAKFDPLEFLASYFNLIEINNTFYRVPSPGMCRSWTERVASRADFRFAVKAHRDITHGGAPASARDIDSFKTAIDPISSRGKLGSILVQFPWSFRMSRDTRDYVRSLHQWFSPLPTTIEVRHGSWESPAGLAFFRDHNIPLCGIDQPMIGDSLGPGSFTTGGSHAYFRLHGRNRSNWFRSEAGRDERYDYLYSQTELSFWRKQIEVVATGVENLIVVLNNHFRGQAVANALQLSSMLSGEKQSAPPELVATYPGLGESLRSSPPTVDRKKRGTPRQLGLFGDENQDEDRDDPE